jgi:hypothetical protein
MACMNLSLDAFSGSWPVGYHLGTLVFEEGRAVGLSAFRSTPGATKILLMRCDKPRAGGVGRERGPMTGGARYAISIDGTVRTHRDVQEIAIEAANFLKAQNRTAKS